MAEQGLDKIKELIDSLLASSVSEETKALLAKLVLNLNL